jgi:excisionase family DNA binding protein
MAEQTLKPFVTTEELAAFLGVTPNCVYKWRLEGRGPAYLKVSSRVRYARDDVQAWLARHRVDPEVGE